MTKVAHIDPVEWDKGAEHVNALIADIRLKHIAETRPLGEDAIAKGADGLWHRTGRSDIDPDILRDAIAAVEDELHAIRAKLEGPQANMFTALAADFTLLEERLSRYPDRPLRLHDTFLRVQAHIASNLASGELPDDHHVHDLYSVLGTASLDMRNACAKTNEVIQARVNARFAETDDETRTNILQISEAAATLSDDELGKEFREDAKYATDPDLPEAEKKPALYRLTTRLSIMALRAGKDIAQAFILLGEICGGVTALVFIVRTILAFLL
ncbi:MAG: hypothetical protein Q8Q26_06065 [Pseudorhodobacter sp.]|nr:hypothetical protein [Pseudorhodobacter sp.]